ncbi:MAG TPA: type IV pilus modification protein PilV [Steroidobacteraceae bacterium]|nr:type IV pilus modification protein PilV [Steroidobacteraceae bacterium]
MKPTVHTMRGFSLIEVMVALIIIAVGMLGIAKMQALGLSTTTSSGSRSLVAIEAASLAASMHTNRDYWVSGPPPAVTHITVTPTGPQANNVNIDVSALSATQNCATTSVCTAAQVAAYDVQAWASALGQVVPASQTTITCTQGVTPVACTIQISWQENVTSTNNTTAAASSTSGALNQPQYTLYVEP